jgi:TPR repeat protein
MSTILCTTRRGQRCPAIYLALLASVLTIIQGCATTSSPEKNSVVICNDDGCVERNADYAAPEKPKTLEEIEEANRLAALEAKAKNDPGAAYDLGLRYFRGDGVRQNSYKALQWMRDAGDRGDLEAQKALGRFYLTGLEEMGSDPQEAEKWLMIAASRGDEESAKLLKQANAAKRSAQDWYTWRTHWRPIFYRYWYHGYPYRYYWRHGYWVYH